MERVIGPLQNRYRDLIHWIYCVCIELRPSIRTTIVNHLIRFVSNPGKEVYIQSFLEVR